MLECYFKPCLRKDPPPLNPLCSSFQDNLMLEKACMAVEEAAKGGGVYPEVLFEVAHQWFWLYEQTAGGSSTAREGATSCSASGIRAAGEAGRGLPEGRGGPRD